MKIVDNGSRYMKAEFPFWINRCVHGSVAEHGHDFVELVYVERGSGFHLFGGERYPIRTGDVFIINPGEMHAYSVDPGQELEIINCLFMSSLIPGTLVRELEIFGAMDYFYVHPFLRNELRFNHRLNLHGQAAATVLSILDGMIKEFNKRSPGYTIIIRLQLIELLILLSRHYSLMQEHKARPSMRQLDREMTARRIYGYLERNYENKITLESLAGLFNVSVRQLNRLMRQEFGSSIIDMLHRIRIEKAKHLLSDSDEKVITIATMVGYDDPSFFSRLFLRHVGCSPSQYRSGYPET